jgi:hypothetical protein
MVELSPDNLKAADVIGQFMDDQIQLPSLNFRGRMNLLPMLYQTVLCPDAYLESNVELLKFLHQTDFQFITEGILAPILRKETRVGLEATKVKNLYDLHQIYKQIGMYDGKITKDPEQVLLDKIGPDIIGIHQRVSESTSKGSAKIVRNPPIHSNFEEICQNIEERKLIANLGILHEWKNVIQTVKDRNKGIIPGRKQIYEESRGLPNENVLCAIADWIYYTNMWRNALMAHPSMDYPSHIDQVYSTAVRLTLEDTSIGTSKIRLIDELVKEVEGMFPIDGLSKIKFEEILDIRRDYSIQWWNVLNKKDIDIHEIWESYEPLHVRILEASGKQYKKMRIKFTIKFLELGWFGTGLLITLQNPIDPIGWSLLGGDIALWVADYFVSKNVERHRYGKIGHSLLSQLEQKLTENYKF